MKMQTPIISVEMQFPNIITILYVPINAWDQINQWHTENLEMAFKGGARKKKEQEYNVYNFFHLI